MYFEGTKVHFFFDISKFFSTFAQNFEQMEQLKGLGTALITPFTESGAVDYEALDRLIDIQNNGGTDYLIVLGTTGEAATLTTEEKATVCKRIISKVDGRIPLVLGLGGNCTAQVLSDIQRLRDTLIEHFVAILSVCPYYNKPNQEGLYRHFMAIAQACPIPVILYNVPGRTGVNMLPTTAMRIWRAAQGKVIGIKEASGKLDQIRQLIQMVRQEPKNDFAPLMVISGDDSLAVPIIMSGGAGLISVASNAWPKEIGTMIRTQDKEMQQRYAQIIKYLFEEGNPGGIKTVLSQMGVIKNVLRLPLVPNSPMLQGQIAKEIASLV